MTIREREGDEEERWNEAAGEKENGVGERIKTRESVEERDQT